MPPKRRSSDAKFPSDAMKWPELRRVRRDTLCYCLYAQVRGTWFASLAHVIGERQKESAADTSRRHQATPGRKTPDRCELAESALPAAVPGRPAGQKLSGRPQPGPN